MKHNFTNKGIHKIVGPYWLEDKIGSGAYSQVFLGRNIKNLEKVAIKVISNKKIANNPRLVEGFKNQMRTLVQAKSSPYIIKFLDYLQTKNNSYFVYEYCCEGNLNQLIAKQQFISQKKAIEYFKQLLQGFKVLVSLNVIHRDIKPENILLKNGKLKIADFGFCKILQQSNSLTNSMMGTPRYMAPQIAQGDQYCYKCDIYSLGVVLYKMLFGRCPYEGCGIIQMLHQLQNKQLIFPPEIQISSKTKYILRRVLQKDQNKRCQWSELFSYFFQEERNTDLLADSLTPLLLISKQNCQKEVQNSLKQTGSTVLKDSQATLAETKKEQDTPKKEQKLVQQDNNVSEDNLSSEQVDQESYEIQTLIEKHKKILQITDIIFSILKLLNSEGHLKIVKLCVTKLKKQLIIFNSKISNNEDFEQIKTLLKQNITFICQISEKTQINKIHLSKKEEENHLQLVLDVLNKSFTAELKSLRRDQLVLAVRLIGLFENNIVHYKSYFQGKQDDQLITRLCSYLI